MKILHVIPGLSPLFGGPSKVVLEMCRELQRHGFEVEIATTDTDMQGNITMPLGRPVKVDEVMVWCFRCPMFRKYGFSLGLTRWLKDHIAEYSILHIHAFFSYITVVTTYYAKKHGIPYIIRPIGQLNPWCFGQNAWKKRPFYWALGLPILRGAATIHVTSEMERQALIHFGFAEKSVVIPLGVEVPLSYPISSTPNSCNHVPHILFLSRVDPKKGLNLLLEAIRLLKDRGIKVELSVAGSGELSYMGEMKALVRRLCIENEVHFLGFVAGEEKQRCLAGSDVFVLPSYDENFGVAVVEAMAAGLPVIISDQVSLAKDVEEAGAGLVIPAGSIDRLTEAIVQIVSDAAMQKNMGCQARKLVEQRFTWSRAGGQLADSYRALI